MPRALAFILALVAVACGLAAVGMRLEGARAARTATERTVVLETTRWTWRAPGAPFRLRGRARPGTVVTLAVAGRPVDRTTVPGDGRFVLTGRPAAPGRHAVSVLAAGRRYPAGSVLVRPVTLAAVGDVMLERDDPRLWTSVGPLLRRADVATANLEGPISTRGVAAAGKDYTFRGPPRALERLAADTGIDVLTLANNHTLDFGRDAFLDTLRHARELGLATVGAGGDEAAARRPAVVVRGGLRIAFLGYSDVNPLGFPAGAGVPGTARAWPAHVAEDVARARRRNDLVVVWFHWGEELAPEPGASQRRLAAEALAAGATVVLGAHPHVLGAVERPQPRRLVAWTLGNFAFPSFRDATRRTGILLVDLDARGVRGWRLRPARIDGARPAVT